MPTRRGVPVVLAVVAVLLQVAYPLVTAQAPRDRLTVATVVVFTAAVTAHAAVHRGLTWAAAYLAVTAGTGFVAEAVGTATGVPFGEYAYAQRLGPSLLDVPLVIPLAWAMVAYPALLVARRLTSGRLRRIGLGAVALASWDLFLDPQMVAAGHWRWADVEQTLPGVPAVPVSNYLGWLVVAVVLMTALDRLPDCDADDRVPATLYLWTYASSVLGAAAFFGRPAVALWGGLAMGAVAVPYAASLRRAAS